MKPPLPQLPSGPDPAKPAPRDPVAGYDLAGYARVAAELAENAEPRADVLARAGLSESGWLAIEKTWLLRLTTAALQGDMALLNEHDAALAAAQAERAAAAPPPSLEDYARVLAAIEGGQDPALAIAGAGLSIAAFARSHQSFTAKMAVDEALASTLRATVERLRRGGGQGAAP